MTVIKTTLSREQYEAVDAKAKRGGKKLAAVMRDLLIEWEAGATPSTESGPLTTEEKQGIKDWHAAAMIGDAVHLKPSEWREQMHERWVALDHNLPPLPPNPLTTSGLPALLTWVHAAHDLLPRDLPTPPRYQM